jgi:hypothetical protein
MCYKREILPPVLLNLQCSLSGISVHGQSDGSVEYTVQNMEGLALQFQAIGIGQIVDTTTQDVVFRDDFFDIKSVLHPLYTVNCRAGVAQRLRDGLVRA